MLPEVTDECAPSVPRDSRGPPGQAEVLASPPHQAEVKGKLDVQLLQRALPDASERIFYISGPYGFVRSVKDELLKMSVPNKKIISDYFPGYG